MNIHHSTVHTHLKKLGYKSKLDVWIPHELKNVHLTARINICDMLIRLEENSPFLKRLIIGDEKWIVYNNVVRKRYWSRRYGSPQTKSKQEVHQRKVMLSVWWDCKGVIFFELLPRNQTINSDVYCRQLDSLSKNIIQKRPGLVNRKRVTFHYDNVSKIIGTWIGYYTTSNILTWPFTVRFPFVSLIRARDKTWGSMDFSPSSLRQ